MNSLPLRIRDVFIVVGFVLCLIIVFSIGIKDMDRQQLQIHIVSELIQTTQDEYLHHSNAVLAEKNPPALLLLLLPAVAKYLGICSKNGADVGQSVLHTPDPMDANTQCHWLKSTDTKPPFSMCLYSMEEDRGISSTLHSSRRWGNFDEKEMDEIFNANHTRDTVIDVGAYVGFFSLMAASRGLNVIAFEANGESASRLQCSVEKNGFQDRLRVYHNAVSNRRGRMLLSILRGNMGADKVTMCDSGDCLPTSRDEFNVDSIVLDDLSAAEIFSPHQILAIHINAEGMDGPILDGASYILRMGKIPHLLVDFLPAWIETYGCSTSLFIRKLYEMGYTVQEHPSIESILEQGAKTRLHFRHSQM